MPAELESKAAMQVGHLVFAFARLDFMLALALRNLLQSQTPDDLNPLIERLGFKERLDALRELVEVSKTLRPEAVQQFDDWYKAADRLRMTRNAFVHGRWGMETRDSLFNASTKVGKVLSGEAKVYSLSELETEAKLAKQVIDAFYEWHLRHVVNEA
ncbi:hypothetical protein AACH06_30005 [Ideonella sp. DXS29W]|uniref:RiboL-PSP-HEPN domain-containing protein n=1 Tax=Ideonella lacteola TaxID=2984193 RepID=A0ABU9C1Y5_9BURK